MRTVAFAALDACAISLWSGSSLRMRCRPLCKRASATEEADRGMQRILLDRLRLKGERNVCITPDISGFWGSATAALPL